MPDVQIKLKRGMKNSGPTGAGARAFTIQGVEKLRTKLQALPPKIAKKHLRQAMRLGARTVLRKAKKLVPVDADGHQLPGGKHLRDTLKIRATKARRGSKNEISLKVMTGTRQELGISHDEKGYYPFALEYGSLDWQPRPYMEPAYRATETPVKDMIRAKIFLAIQQEVKG